MLLRAMGATEALKQGEQHPPSLGVGLAYGGQGPGPRVLGMGDVAVAGPTSWPSLPPSGVRRPVSTDACGAKPGKLLT